MDLDSVSRGSEESSEVTLDTESSNNRKDDRHSTSMYYHCLHCILPTS